MPSSVIGAIAANAVVGVAQTFTAMLVKAAIPCRAGSCVIDGAL